MCLTEYKRQTKTDRDKFKLSLLDKKTLLNQYNQTSNIGQGTWKIKRPTNKMSKSEVR